MSLLSPIRHMMNVSILNVILSSSFPIVGFPVEMAVPRNTFIQLHFEIKLAKEMSNICQIFSQYNSQQTHL